MPISHLLEDFRNLTPQNAPTVSLSAEGLEDQRLESFEQGYKAGWEDAIQAQSDDHKKISVDLARNLLDLSFTYHEAFTAFSAEMKPLLQEMVKTLLPQMAEASLGARIVEQLDDLAQKQAGGGILIHVAPENLDAVASLLSVEMDMPFSLHPDPHLGSGQVNLRFGNQEQQIDMNEVLQGISEAVSGFFHETDKELKHA